MVVIFPYCSTPVSTFQHTLPLETVSGACLANYVRETPTRFVVQTFK